MHLFIYCAGGFGKEVIDIARGIQRTRLRWNNIAFLDDCRADAMVYGAQVFRLDAALQRFGSANMEAVIATGEPFVRGLLDQKLEASGVRLTTIVSEFAVVSESASLAAGCIVSPGCLVSSEAILGRNVALVAGACVGHNVQLGDNCVVAGHVNIGGACTVGSETYLGMGAQVKQLIRIGRGAVVGMGSVVFNDIPDNVIALGNPCRLIRPNSEKRVFP